MSTQPPSHTWFKSSRSNASEACVEVFLGEQVGVRDSKDPSGPELWFTGSQWDEFLRSGIWRG